MATPKTEKKVVKKAAAPKAAAAPKVVKAPKTRVAKVSKGTPVGHGVGRRKSCVARVWLRRNGEGKVTVNNLDLNVYFDTALTRASAMSPFKAYALSGNFNADVNVVGGGKVGQADAVKLAIARAFLEQDETLRPVLRKAGMLTVDSRVKERKKYGQKAARRKFQFVKR
jgi:small subunit ribosomal protein S9